MRFLLLAIPAVVVVGAAAQAQPKPSEADRQSSTMGPPSGNREGANNGIGTSGSIAGNDGKATSRAGSTPFNAEGGNKGAGGTMENDPALGGGQQQR